MCTIRSRTEMEGGRPILSPVDVRRVNRFVEGCRDRGDDCAVWMRFLVGRLVSMLNADAGTAGQFEIAAAAGPEQPAGVQGVPEPPAAADPRASGFFLPSRIDPALLERCRRIAVTDGATLLLSRSDCASGCGDQLTVLTPIASGSSDRQAVILVRDVQRAPFEKQAVAVLDYAMETVAPLVGRSLASFRDKRPADLPPRVQQVLARMLAGDSAKQTAARLGISVHTVNQYATTLFSFFEVQSRTELMACWIARGWRPHVVPKDG